MSAAAESEIQSLRHLHALRSFIGNLVEQAEKSGGCECHKPPSLLLVGPPGAGKTYLVKQMSKVCEMPLFGVHTHQVANAASIKNLFSQARENYPSLVFLDDVDSIFANHERDRPCTPPVQNIREEIFMELGPRKLKIKDPDSSTNPTEQQIHNSPGGSSSSRASSRSSSLSRQRPSAPELNDSYDESLYPDNNGIIVVAATSAPWLLYKDHELLSRFRGVYLVGLPDQASRYTLLQTLLNEIHHTLSDEDIMNIAEKTQGYTPADLMVVMKTLSYKQFSFLLSMTNGIEGSAGNSSSGSPSPTSSDLETGSDTDIDGLSEPKGKGKGVSSGNAVAAVAMAAAATAAAHMSSSRQQKGVAPQPPTAAPSDPHGPVKDGPGGSPAGGEGLMGRCAAAGAAVTALQQDWASDSDEEDEETGLVTQRERVAGNPNSTSPDSGLVVSRSSEEAIVARLDQPDGGVRQVELHQDSARNTSDNALLSSSDNIGASVSAAANDRLQHNESSESDDVSGRHQTQEEHQFANNHITHDDLPNTSFTSFTAPEEGDNNILPARTTDNNTSYSGKSSRSQTTEPTAPQQINHCESESPSPPASLNASFTNEDGEVVDATGCSETEEVIVHQEFADASRPRINAERQQQQQGANVSSCPSDDDDDPATGPHNDGNPNNTRSDDRSIEIHYSEPPEPLRDDNLAVDSDSDNESPVMRPRRVGFASRSVAIDPLGGGNDVTGGGSNGYGGGGRPPAMSPISVDCGDMPPNISLDGGGADNILRQLLARPSIANNGGNSSNCSPTPPASPTGSRCSSGAATLASSGRNTPQDMHHQQDGHHNNQQTPPLHRSSHHSSPHHTSPHHTSGHHTSPLHTSSHHTSPLHTSPHHTSPLHTSPHHTSPLHTSPLHNSPHHISGHEGPGNHHISPHRHNNSQQQSPLQRQGSRSKTGDGKSVLHDDNNSGLGLKAVTGLGAAAVFNAMPHVDDNRSNNASTAAAVTEDDMAKLINALEQHLDGGAEEGGATGSSCTDDDETCSEDDDDTQDEHDGETKAAMHAIDEAAAVGIQPITLTDVLEVISKGYRSVSDEEIKKYTDFMVWFASVAKSACPHNNGNASEAPTIDEDDCCVESTLCATPSLRKNARRKPLKKLGKFLLKALMFILD